MSLPAALAREIGAVLVERIVRALAAGRPPANITVAHLLDRNERRRLTRAANVERARRRGVP